MNAFISQRKANNARHHRHGRRGRKFQDLCRALTAANLVDTLKGAGPFTVFAPTDEALAKVLSKETKPGKVKTVQGTGMTIATTGSVTVDEATVNTADVLADNGVIDVIDTVLIPK